MIMVGLLLQPQVLVLYNVMDKRVVHFEILHADSYLYVQLSWWIFYISTLQKQELSHTPVDRYTLIEQSGLLY